MIRLLRFCLIMLYGLSSEDVHWVIWICFDLHLPVFVISSFCLRVSCVSFLSCGCSAVCWTLTISFVLICHTVQRFMLSLWSCRGCSCLGELQWVFSWFFRVGQVVLRDIVAECILFGFFSFLTGWSTGPIQKFTQEVNPISKLFSSWFALSPLFLFAV